MLMFVGLTAAAAAPVWAQDCAPVPVGIVSWWPGDVDPSDIIGANDATLVGAATFAPSLVTQGFKFGGSGGDAAGVGNPPNLQLQNFTIEAWVSRSATGVASFDAGGGASLPMGTTATDWFFFDDGRLVLSKIDVSEVHEDTPRVTDLNFHHVAVTKVGGTVVFYVDGVGITAPPYNPGLEFTTNAAIGARGDNFIGSFLGIVDDEIKVIFNAGSAGKCQPQ